MALDQTEINQLELAIQNRAILLARQIADEQIQRNNLTTKIFTTFNLTSDIISNQKAIITEGLFSDEPEPITSNTTITLRSLINYDTGSIASNLPNLDLTKFIKLTIDLQPNEYTSTTYLNNLQFYSSSILLSTTGSLFISSSKIAAIVTASQITLPVNTAYSSSNVYNRITNITDGIFNSQIYTTYTSSLQTAVSKRYYYNIYQNNPLVVDNIIPQFAIAYGHRLGSGSFSEGQLNDSSTKAVYSQYKQLLLEPEDSSFTFNNENSDLIYIINFNRNILNDRLDPGNWQFSLAQLNGAAFANNDFTGSNVTIATNPAIISLIDDSGDTNQSVGFSTNGKIYNIISGTIENGPYVTNNDYVYYGLAYPDMGILVLNGNALNTSLNFNTVTGSAIDGQNIEKFWISINGAMQRSYAFQARKSKIINSTHYFVRVLNNQYNFSNNPSFTTGSVGEFSQPTFIGDPKTYITTVGMYNDNQELLAIAKLSQPIQKSFQNETLIKVKLDF